MKSAFFISLLGVWVCMTSCSNQPVPVPVVAMEENLTLLMKGNSMGIPTLEKIKGVNIEADGIAYSVDFYDADTGTYLGKVTDYRTDTEVFDDGSQLTESYTVFSFEGNGDILVIHHLWWTDPLGNETFSVVFEPEPNEPNVLGGTGKYAEATGMSFLRGTIKSSGSFGDEIEYNCNFEIKLNLDP